MEIKIHIGIDPDVHKSGIAIWDSKNKRFNYIGLMSFWEIINEFESQTKPFEVVIEGGWLINKSNWHDRPGQSKQAGEAIAKNVGRNHQVGLLLRDYCKNNRITVRTPTPQGKITDFGFKKITKWAHPTNQEQRDAAMLVFQCKSLKLA